jgi:hypothetical protein
MKTRSVSDQNEVTYLLEVRFTLRQSNVAIEDPPFIDYFPIKIKTFIYKGSSIATFDCRRVNLCSISLFMLVSGCSRPTAFERERVVHVVALQVLDMKRAFDMIDEVRFGRGLWSLDQQVHLGITLFDITKPRAIEIFA